MIVFGVCFGCERPLFFFNMELLIVPLRLSSPFQWNRLSSSPLIVFFDRWFKASKDRKHVKDIREMLRAKSLQIGEKSQI